MNLFTRLTRTGTILQVRLMWGVFSNANDMNLFLMTFPHMSLHCKLVPVRYREYKYRLFLDSLALLKFIIAVIIHLVLYSDSDSFCRVKYMLQFNFTLAWFKLLLSFCPVYVNEHETKENTKFYQR